MPKVGRRSTTIANIWIGSPGASMNIAWSKSAFWRLRTRHSSKTRYNPQIISRYDQVPYVGIDDLRHIFTSKGRNTSFLMTSDRFSRLRTVLLLCPESAHDIAEAFTKHRFFLKGPSHELLFYNKKQFTARSFTDVYLIVRLSNLYITWHHQEFSGQAKRFDRINVADQLPTWKKFADALTYEFNTKPHSGTELDPFGVLLAPSSPTVPVKAFVAITHKLSTITIPAIKASSRRTYETCSRSTSDVISSIQTVV